MNHNPDPLQQVPRGGKNTPDRCAQYKIVRYQSKGRHTSATQSRREISKGRVNAAIMNSKNTNNTPYLDTANRLFVAASRAFVANRDTKYNITNLRIMPIHPDGNEPAVNKPKARSITL